MKTPKPELLDLIEIVRSGSNKDAVKAIDEIRYWGWHHGKHLHGINLSGARLKGANLRHFDLRDANLTNASLDDTNLRGTILYDANLSGAFLNGADLRDAKLSRANLQQAELRGVYLRGASLNDASLENANLRGAYFGSRTDLRNTDFSGTILGYTTFSNVDLNDALNLDKVTIEAPNSIGVDTLFQLSKPIPEVFLRKCGVPEPVLIRLNHMIVRAEGRNKRYDAFISYSSNDEEFASILYDDLSRIGFECFKFTHETYPDKDIYEKIFEGIKRSEKMILCASENALVNSPYVEEEISLAINIENEMRREHSNASFLIVLKLDDFVHSTSYAGGKASRVKSKDAIDLREWRDQTTYDAKLRILKQEL